MDKKSVIAVLDEETNAKLAIMTARISKRARSRTGNNFSKEDLIKILVDYEFHLHLTSEKNDYKNRIDEMLKKSGY